ncbi:hypothetical protein BZG36_03804 [Bifiguratus adelaidae]|uniref:RNA exonuclease 4 n=1 Tax=Bifiguratus adelaidae TaxID=1938954 RepID=A0A261XX09_9FUNG|nr:hypothetical protein BZG36_03804 [Bifiguratus adelaidae]
MSSNWRKLQKQLGITPKVNSKKRKLEDTKEETDSKKSKDVNVKDVWFDDVNEKDIKAAYGEIGADNKQVLKEMDNNDGRKAKLGKYVAIDCEMVGVGPEGKDSALARVSIVNFHGACLLDRYVKPMEKVTDYRTFVSGIEPKHIKDAPHFSEIQKEVAKILKGRIIVGHAIRNDFKALLMEHPKRDIRDTSRYKPFRKLVGGRTPGLKKLAKELLGLDVQSGKHSSVEDARVTMMIYKHVKKEWEKQLGSHARKNKSMSTPDEDLEAVEDLTDVE